MKYVGGLKKTFRSIVPKKWWDETQIYKYDAFFWPHGTEKCLAQRETIELIIGIVSDIYPEKVRQIREAEELKNNAAQEMDIIKKRLAKQTKKLHEAISILSKVGTSDAKKMIEDLQETTSELF